MKDFQCNFIEFILVSRLSNKKNMKKKLSLFNIVSSLTFLFYFTQCKKDKSPLNITLYNKPLNTIQTYTKGKWRLQYEKGGFCGTCIYPAKYNAYIILTPAKIVIGNDSLGVIVDTIVIWKKEPWGTNFTYLLSYRYSSGYAFPYYYFINEIKNDTLLLSDYASDPVYHYYTKFN
jgi:hypothetical protein